MLTAHLHGYLARAHGPGPYRYDAASVAECARALMATHKGFKANLRRGTFRIVCRLRGGRELELGEEMLAFRLREAELHFVPVPAGAKNSGIGKVVAGVVIAVAAVAISIASAGTLTPLALNFVVAGVGLTLSGVATMLTPTPQVGDYTVRERPEERPSSLYGPTNTSEEGQCVPVVIGRMRVGSAVISSGVFPEQVAFNGDPDAGDTSGADIDPNTLQSRAVARIIDALSEGPILGLVDGLQGVFFNDTAVQNDDGTFNFEGVEVKVRNGTSDQDPIPGFPAVEREVGVNAQVENGTPIIRTITSEEVNAVRVTIALPSLLWQQTDGDIRRTHVEFAIDVRNAGGSFVQVGPNQRISGKTSSPYERSYRVDLEAGAGPWDIRVRRITADSTSELLQNDLFWARYTELVERQLIYPDTAIAGVTLDSALFGDQIPRRSYLIDGIKMQVPNNYNPFTRSYDGIWEGTFKTEWTNNPAWVLYLFATNRRFGLGQWLDASKVDKWALYEIGQYCDELVDDGFGGQEPRFTANGVINTRHDAMKLLQLIASTFRGMAYWAGGTITATQDSPADAAILVAPANVEDGHFNYSGAGFKARHSAALVTWTDLERGGKPAIESVENPDLIARFGWRPADLVAFLCTSRGQARRLGKWLLDTEQFAKETLTYRAGFDHMIADGTAVMPGDVIQVADPTVAGVRFGGRLASAGGSTDGRVLESSSATRVTEGGDRRVLEAGESALGELHLDAEITLEAGETYTVTVVMPDGTLATRDITNSAGATDILTLDEDLSELPETGAIWVVTASNVAPREFRVVAVREAQKNLVEVTALLHDPTKYARVEQGIQLAETPFSIIPNGKIAAPADIDAVEYLYKEWGTIKSAITVSWDPVPDARVVFYELDVKRPSDADFVRHGITTAVHADVLDTPPGLYSFRVKARDALGHPGLTRTKTLLTFGSGQAIPDDIEGFRVDVIGEDAHLSWTPVTSLNLSHYELRFQAVTSGASWGAATVMVERISKDSSTTTVPALVGTYLLKAVSVEGAYSTAVAAAGAVFSGIAGFNAVDLITEDPDFGGTKTDVVVDGDDLILDSDDDGFLPTGTYEFEEQSVDLGAVFTSRVTVNITVAGDRASNTMATWTTLAMVETLSGAEATNWTASVEMATTQDDPAGTPTWSDWTKLLVGYYTARAFKFRLILTSPDPDVTPRVSALAVTVDMPDRVEWAKGATVPDTGLDVTYTTPFKAVPSVAVTIEGGSAGDNIELTAEDETGFSLMIKNGGVGVERQVNWIAQGYGSLAA
jgi:predicted phage tail protein